MDSNNKMDTPESIASRSSSENDPSNDLSLSDLKQDELSNDFKNVGFVKDENLQSEIEDWSESETDHKIQKRDLLYPLRPGAEDCSFYLRYGCCKFGSTCKFNHPLQTKVQVVRYNKVKEKEVDDVDKLGLVDCKYYFMTGGCKFGEACKFNHANPKSYQSTVLPELNFAGLPIRQGEIECPYYMRTGSCKYGAECKFNHPDPSTIGGTDSPSFHGNNGGSIGSFSPKSTFQASSTSWSSPRQASGTNPFIPQARRVPSQTPEWNGYQASVYSSERNVFTPATTYLMNNSLAETNILSSYKHQMPAEEFPERPDQPECSYYLKTGDCKFKFTCKYHHPKNRLLKQPPFALNDKGLPLRPDQDICTHYSRYGICKFGPACRFDHSVQPSYPPGSSQAVVELPQIVANGNETDGWN